MSTIHGIDNYSDNYKKYGKKVLEETAETLNKAGIKVFPQVYSQKKENTDFFVDLQNNNDNSDIETNDNIKNKNNKNGAKWIRQAMHGHNNPVSIHSSVMSRYKTHLGNVMQIRNSQTPDSNDTSTYNNIQDIENQTSNIDKLSNASNDEGNGNLLKTFFEKSVSEGYHTDNFAGTNYEKNVIDGTYNNNAVIYSDNLYHKGNTSIILGGTVDASFSKDNGNNIDYNVYSYGKYKAKKLTYGLGAINTKNNGVNNVNISAGAQHNSTGIYAIIEKDLNMIPGLPTSSKTHIKVGIGKESGLLDPDEYNPKNKNIENIDKIDVQEEFVESKEGSVYGIDDIDYKSVKNNTVVNLIISDTDSCKEYGIKGGYIFRKVTKKENYAFAMPYGQISNTNADSKEGVKFVLGANAGQNLNTKNGWNILTKGVLEASRHIVCGQRPSDYILGNINFKANNNKFNGEVSVGAYFDSDKTFCKYLESKVGYTINKNLSAGVKAGIANYKYSTNENKDFQVAAGVHYTF